MSVVVLGSLNMDLVVAAERLPRPGETVSGGRFFTVAGGKGANQAVAAARMGAPTCMLGRVGDDAFGRTLIQGLVAEGIDARGVALDPDAATGIASIVVDVRGENVIVVAPGANGRVGGEELGRLEVALGTGAASGRHVLLVQLEIPAEVVAEAARVARAREALVVLDPAPARPLPDELLRHVDVLTPNETEASALVGFAVENADAARRAVAVLRARGPRTVVVKRGAAGVVWGDGHSIHDDPAFRVEAVDTVAAGDAFNGALAAALLEGLPLEVAVRRGQAAGALSTTCRGAQPSLPHRDAVLGFG